MKCLKCRTQNQKDHKFCHECGAFLDINEQKLRNQVIKEAERKRVTALFSDLSGYTAMTEKLDPEEVKQIMTTIFDGMKEVIKKYGGFIEHSAGDSILALFGVPKTHEDDPMRAIYAAREIHEFVASLSPDYKTKVGIGLSMHSGINTGLVVTADLNQQKGTHKVTGDVINIAARLSDIAKPHEILVGPEAYKACKNSFIFQDLNPVKVKGKIDPIVIHKLLDSNLSGPKGRNNRQVSSKMVGRDKEIDKLELQVSKVINGEGSVINIIGEAGIGKSRLIAELKNRDVMKRVIPLEGRAISIGKNLSFHPIIDLLKQWANITEEDSETRVFEKLEKAVRKIDTEDTDEILPFIAILMGMKLKGRHAQRVKGIEGEALEKLIGKNVRDLIIKGSEIRPTVVIMEDLHWADTSSIELLETLYRLAENHRLLFLNVFRPGYLEGDNVKIKTIGQKLPICFVEIKLKPLEKHDSKMLIQNMLDVKGLPTSIRDHIVDRAGGNPFFIEEVVRSLIDEGAVVKTDTGFEVTNKIKNIIIPSTINDVLIARIDRLEESSRELIKIASVIGRSFFDRIIKDVAESIEKVDDKLKYLKNVQLIRDRIRMQELEYLFKHTLAQEAVYESTLLQQRKKLHYKVAQSIEKNFQDRIHEFYGMLAFHYSKADKSEKAEEYMMKAGEEALKASASTEAIHYFQEALRLYLEKYGSILDPYKLIKFEKNLAIAFYSKGRWEEAFIYFDKALERLGMSIPRKRLPDIRKTLLSFLVLLKVIYFKLPNSKKKLTENKKSTFDLYYKAMETLSYIDDIRQFFGAMKLFLLTTKYDISSIPNLSTYWTGISGSFSISGISFKLSNRLLQVAKQFVVKNDTSSLMNYVFVRDFTSHCQGTWGKINNSNEDLLNQSLRVGDFWMVTNYMWAYGLVKAEQGEFDQLNNVVDKLFEFGEKHDYGLSISQARSLRIHLFLKFKNAHKALSESDKVISYALEIGFLGYRAEAQLLTGNLDGALDTIQQATQIYEKQSLLPLFKSDYFVARLLIDIEQLRQSIHFGNSVDVSHFKKQVCKTGKVAVRNARKYAPCRVRIFSKMGDYFWLIKKQKKALMWWDKAIQEGDRLGARPDLSRTYFKVGKSLLEPKSKYTQLQGINANEYLGKARIMFEEMNLQHDLDKLDRLI